MLQHEHEQRLRLEEMVEQLARQHSNLEQAAKEASVNPNSISAISITSNRPLNVAQSDEDEENEFFDAEEGTEADFIVTLPHMGHRYEQFYNVLLVCCFGDGICWLGAEGSGNWLSGMWSQGPFILWACSVRLLYLKASSKIYFCWFLVLPCSFSMGDEVGMKV